MCVRVYNMHRIAEKRHYRRRESYGIKLRILCTSTYFPPHSCMNYLGIFGYVEYCGGIAADIDLVKTEEEKDK